MSNKALLIGGAALLAVGGFALYQNRQANSDADATTAYDPWLAADPVGLAGPNSIAASAAGGFGGGGGGMVAGPSPSPSPVTPTPASGGYSGDNGWMEYGNTPLAPSPAPGQSGPFPTVDGIDPATAELLSQQRLAMEYDFQYSMASLQYNTYVSGTNAWLQYESLKTLEYSTAANLASQFMFSNNQATFTQVRDASGNVILDFGGVNMRDSKKDRWNETIVQNLPSIASQFNSAQGTRAQQTYAPPPMPDFSSYYTVPDRVGPKPAPISAPTGWSPPTTTVQPTQVIAPTATVSPTVSQPTLQPTAPTTYQPTSYVSSGGGARSGYGKVMEL
jgi:hypothetical protein